MPLQPGTRLGPYEIVSALGAGGMGEVYKATDTKLKRQVAIKVLPESVAADAERLARFQREAEVLASLNHPNIAAIHGLEESDGTTACQGRSKIRPPWRRKTRPSGRGVAWLKAAVRRRGQDAGAAAGGRAFLLCSRR